MVEPQSSEQKPFTLLLPTCAKSEGRRSHEDMKMKSYIPYLTVPLAVVMLTIMAVDVLRGQFDPCMDGYRYIIWSILSAVWLISGLIKLNRPYITVDEMGVTVRNRWFSNHPSLVLPWDSIRGHTGRTLGNIRIESLDGRITKIPINGISGRALESLLSVIEARTGNANKPNGE